MAGIDELRADLQKRANDYLTNQLAGGAASVQGFGVGPMLVIAALGTRGDDAGTVNAPPQPINARLVTDVLKQVAPDAPAAIKADEVERVLALLRTGEFHADLAQGIRALLMLLRIAPRSALETILQAPSLPRDLVRAVSWDLFESLDENAVRAFLTDAKDGKIDDPPNFLRNTLAAVLALATLRETVDTLRTLIAPDNQTFRLALIVYARSQGVDLTAEDLDALRAAIDPADPNLGVVFGRGLEYIRRRTGGPNEARDIIQRFGFLNPS